MNTIVAPTGSSKHTVCLRDLMLIFSLTLFPSGRENESNIATNDKSMRVCFRRNDPTHFTVGIAELSITSASTARYENGSNRSLLFEELT